MEKLTPITWPSWPTRHVRVIWHISFVVFVGLASAVAADAGQRRARLSSDLTQHLNSNSTGTIEVIVSGSVEKIERLRARHGLQIKKALDSGAVFSVSMRGLDALSQDSEIESLSGNSRVRSHGGLATDVTGAKAAWAGGIAALGKVNGSGIGVAVLDSGIADHPALAGRVIFSADFTDRRGRGQDYFGHGTHVAGTISSRAFKKAGETTDSGMAPAAHLINLKVLDSSGAGEAADLIQAIDFAIRHRHELGIRILNLSLGAAATLSHRDDPICQAVERAVKAGLVVVVAAGNYGQADDGRLVFGSITSPGISPYAITVGALRTHGTDEPGDDEVAPWSSKGPTAVDHLIKPDLVAPGSKIVSTSAASSSLANMFPDRVVDGPGNRDYLSMSGTSMAAAVVSGAAALLLDSRPSMTPLQVKLALQGSADFAPGGLLVAGAGRLDLEGLGNLDALATVTGDIGYSVPASKTNGQTIFWDGIFWESGVLRDTTIFWDGIFWDSTIFWDGIFWDSTIFWDGIFWDSTIFWDGSAESSTIFWDGIFWDSTIFWDGIFWDSTIFLD